MVERLKDRPTADLIVIFLTGVVGIVLIGSVIAMLIAFLWRPEADITTAATRVATIVSSLVTGIIGFVAGRSSANNHRKIEGEDETQSG